TVAAKRPTLERSVMIVSLPFRRPGLCQASPYHPRPRWFSDRTECWLAADRYTRWHGRCSDGIGAGRPNRTCRIYRKAVTFIESIDVDRWAKSRGSRSRGRTHDRSNSATQEYRNNDVLQTPTENLRHGARP